MASLADILQGGEEILADAGILEPRREAATLISLALGCDRTFLYAHPEHSPAEHDAARIKDLIRRRAGREPLQYIRGTQEFYGIEFEVTPDVLIPRPETELLVELGIHYINTLNGPRFLDIGTGSGCIPVSILKNVATARGIAVDISPAALAVARRNAECTGVADRLKLTESNVYSNVPAERFHLIVSNPPYVPERDLTGLQPEVRDHEPHAALTDGRDGLSMIAEIIRRAPEFLLPSGHLLIEIGFGQAGKVREMAPQSVWESVRVEPDLQGIPRVLTATLR